MAVKDFITKQGTFLITVDDVRFYEFRDLTPNDLLWIDSVNGGDDDRFETFIHSLNFLVSLSKRLVVNCNYDLEKEDWSVFIDVSERLRENVLSQCISWKSFLSLVFACGNKSFTPLENLMNVNMTYILDMQSVLIQYYETQKKAMDEAQRS